MVGELFNQKKQQSFISYNWAEQGINLSYIEYSVLGLFNPQTSFTGVTTYMAPLSMAKAANSKPTTKVTIVANASDTISLLGFKMTSNAIFQGKAYIRMSFGSDSDIDGLKIEIELGNGAKETLHNAAVVANTAYTVTYQYTLPTSFFKTGYGFTGTVTITQTDAGTNDIYIANDPYDTEQTPVGTLTFLARSSKFAIMLPVKTNI